IANWAAAFLANGVEDVMAIDGDYVDRSMLRIDPGLFTPVDLEKPIRLNRAFEMAVCLEVGEHLIPAWVVCFVDELTRLAPVIAFSAAIPGQGGTNHINEQWPSYWTALFAKRRYQVFDCLRARLWYDERIVVCYRQNLLFYVSESLGNLFAGHPRVGLDAVHPEHHAVALQYMENPTLGQLAKALPGALKRSLRKRIGRASVD